MNRMNTNHLVIMKKMFSIYNILLFVIEHLLKTRLAFRRCLISIADNEYFL